MNPVKARRQVSEASIATPMRPAAKPPRYSLKQLLLGSTPRKMAALQEQTVHVHGGPPVGRELI